MGEPNIIYPKITIIGDDISIQLDKENDTTVEIASIYNFGGSPWRVVAFGRMIAKLADSLGVTLIGEIEPFSNQRTSKAYLKKLYSHFGAKERKGMVTRKPNLPQADA